MFISELATESVSELTILNEAITVEIIEYIPNTAVKKTTLKKSAGKISEVFVEVGEGLTEKISPFETFVQLIDGRIELVINGEFKLMQSGQSVIIPAHSYNYIKPLGQFKMISTVIKNEYE